jgi:hypothetical protein
MQLLFRTACGGLTSTEGPEGFLWKWTLRKPPLQQQPRLSHNV